jgi:DNA-directed RNA polymerase specialized sigma24 family protein
MDFEEFMAAVARNLPLLDKLFHKYLRQFKTIGNKKQLREDLIQLTIWKAFKRLIGPGEKNFQTIDHLILQKAKDVRSEMLKGLAKNESHVPVEAAMYQEQTTPNLEDQLDLKARLSTLRNIVDNETWQMIKLIGEGYKYHEIASILNVSVPIIKSKIFRLKQKIRNSHK